MTSLSLSSNPLSPDSSYEGNSQSDSEMSTATHPRRRRKRMRPHTSLLAMAIAGNTVAHLRQKRLARERAAWNAKLGESLPGSGNHDAPPTVADMVASDNVEPDVVLVAHGGGQQQHDNGGGQQPEAAADAPTAGGPGNVMLPGQEPVGVGDGAAHVAQPVVLNHPPPVLVPSITVTVKCMKANDPGIEYRMKVSQTFQRLYYDYAEKVDRLPSDFTLRHANGMVLSSHTPAQVGIRDGEVLFVRPQNPDFNMDARIKQFWLRDVRTRPVRMMFHVRVNCHFRKLFQMWGDEMGVDPNDIVMMHEDKLLSPYHTVHGANVKNDDEVFVLTNC